VSRGKANPPAAAPDTPTQPVVPQHRSGSRAETYLTDGEIYWRILHGGRMRRTTRA